MVTRPLERVFVYFVGPLLRSRAGYSATLIFMDGFPKFVALFPVRHITSKVVVKILWKRYLPSVGIPQIMVTDNAAVFRSKVMYNLCFSWGIRHVTTSPYYP